MTEKEDIVQLCLAYNGVYQDFPFEKNTNYCVIRHMDNKKIFALIFEKDNKIWVNLKCEPMVGDLLRQSYESVVPAYHMNKEHWISVILDGILDNEQIETFVDNSYQLTRPKKKRKDVSM